MDTFLFPIMWVIAWIMYVIHKFFTAVGLNDGPGLAWVLSIVGLTIVVRLLILPLFKKQIVATRQQQIIQPKIKKLQAKYKGKKDMYSQQRMQQEMQAIYKDAGTSPFATCLPMLIQMPIFFALFRVLQNLSPMASGAKDPIGPLTRAIASDIESSTIFGAPLSASFSAPEIGGGEPVTVRIVAMTLVVLMSVTMFFSQRMMITKNMPDEAKSPDNPMYRTQQIMIWLFPIIFLISGVAFPVGVLLYWVVSNIWSAGQSFYMLTAVPAPGSEAYRAKKERERKKRIKMGLPPEEEKPVDDDDAESVGQRVQPVGKSRAKRKGMSREDALSLLDAPQEKSAQDDDESGKKKHRRKKKVVEPVVSEEVIEDDVAGDNVDKGGLTPEERNRIRAQRRAAQREAARKKREQRGQ